MAHPAAPSWLFPLAVFGGFASGVVDGKVRYRKVTAPLLLKKIISGSLLFVVSIVQGRARFGDPRSAPEPPPNAFQRMPASEPYLLKEREPEA